jgi:hypothetical protein
MGYSFLPDRFIFWNRWKSEDPGLPDIAGVRKGFRRWTGSLQSPRNRATVLHETMNVTLKLPDELCKAARHLAVDESKSLSAWMVEIMRREVEARNAKPEKPKTWMDAFSGDENDPYLGRDFPLEDRKTMKIREFNFEE